MIIEQYIDTINTRLKSGLSREHSYRGDLETLIRALVKGVEITNEPTNVTDCGNPDYVITKGIIPVGYIEAKDIGKDLNSRQYKEQFNRYKKALDNLIITDYVWFQFFQNGDLIHEIRIGDKDGNTIKPIPEKYAEFENLINNFCTYIGQTIKSSKKLAEMMASKARLLQNILERALTSDEVTQENTSLREQYETFKNILIHDLSPKEFADIYSQSLAYGMFAARLYDTTLDDFSRYEAAELIPKSNPFLRKLFGYIAGPDIDERILRTVDNLAEVFRATNVEQLLKNFGKNTQTQDPIIHFYETFLAEYDPKLRKSRGVWYTPEPVVRFIVRAVDNILKTEFELPQGIADTSKTTIKVPYQGSKKLIEKEVHKVQILDPATGTGTFLAEVVSFIYSKRFKAMQGAWSSYVDEHLIPRLNGFELLMASYSMAHLKLDMLLRNSGYKATKNQRFHIYLTNSLEEHHPDTGTLFSNWLSTEANEANHIKRDTPVMCVIGNPPYAVSSPNKGVWIQNLLSDYKKDLNERKINLDDDYIKFIRYGQYCVDKTGEGILAYISNNSFIDGITHRQMRKQLLSSFDKIYILDLHGNSKKKEVCPDGSPDQNVFDIMQGVSINIFVRTRKRKKNQLAKVKHISLFGKRDDKYSFLLSHSLSNIKWEEIPNKPPNYFYVPKDFELEDNYSRGFSISELFQNFSTGIETKCDDISIQFKKNETEHILNDFENLELSELSKKYKRKNSAGWNYANAKKDICSNNRQIIRIAYRPFDTRYTIFTGFSSGFMGRPRIDTMKHLTKWNYAISSTRSRRNDASCYFISNFITDKSISSSLDNNYIFPLYSYAEDHDVFKIKERIPNLDTKIINQIADKLGLSFTNEKEESENTFAPIDILDYIYAVLHSPTYRKKYKEFLKIDFPRIPYPKDYESFWSLVKYGSELRKIHLLESSKVEDFITQYPIDGDNVIIKPRFVPSQQTEGNGKVYINDSQYFEDIPSLVWEFYIGGYQPAQKWLKDRRGRKLEYEDILHYQKIIVALSETANIMNEIDKIEIE